MPVTFSGVDLRGTTAFSVAEGFSPYALFASGEQGAWYDPSDMSTMFQDAAGNTRVTEVEQPVGRILDKSGRGNHATQSTSASRPVLSARYNLLTKTEQFNDAAWAKQQATISANVIATTAPDGTSTADKLEENNTTNAHYVDLAVSTGRYTLSVAVKAAERSKVWLFMKDAATCIAYFDLSAGTVLSTAGTAAPTASITSLGNGWYRCSITTPSDQITPRIGFGPTTTDGVLSYAGTTGSGIYIWGADLRVSNDGVGLPVYQRVNTSTDYDTNGFPMYLRFDGTDDSLVTGSINFSGTDKMTVWAGVRKLGSTSFGVLAELSSNETSNNGAFVIFAPSTGSTTYGFALRGTSPNPGPDVYYEPSGYSVPISNVLACSFDIGGAVVANEITPRVNGSVNQTGGPTATNTAGTGNFGNYPLYIGRRGGSTNPLNGRLYSLIVRGASSTAGQISDTEGWVNGRTRAY